MRGRVLPLLLLIGSAAACVESREPPPVPDQATITYGDKIYLVDNTRNIGRTDQTPCTRLGTTATSTDTLRSTDGIPGTIDPTVPHNCFVPVASKSLTVDVVEVTNELYQLCIDSGACQTPDPAQSDRAQLCQNEDMFDVCPVVEIPQTEASNFCAWIGRRLPTTIESIAIRQAVRQADDPAVIKPYILGDGEEPPVACDDAVIAGGSCMSTKPFPVLNEDGSPKGGAPRDVIPADKNIYDLTGNVAEWTSDRVSSRRGNADDLPWFCIAALPEVSTTTTSSTTPVPPPTCPTGLEGLRCAYAQYDPPGADNGLGVYPLCLTTENGAFSGDIGVLMGGTYRDSASNATEERDYYGIFGRRPQSMPDELSDGSLARQYGIRCVDNRDSAGDDGVVPTFLNELEVVTLP